MKVLNIITGLGKGGAENTLYKLNIENNDETKMWNFSLSNLDYYGDLLIKNNYHALAFNIFSNPLKIISLIREINRIKPDVILAWMYHPILITFLLKLIFFRTKFFWNLRGTFESSKHSLFSKLFIKISIFFSTFVPHKIICCSDQVRKNFREIGYPDNKLVTINNGYDFKYLNFDYTLKEKIRKKYKLNGETILFGMASRFNEQKDYSNLLRALELLTKQKSKNIKFLFAGMGNVDSNKNLVNLIKKFNLEDNIVLLGYMNIKNFFHLIDIHVLSSSHGEGFPNVVAESMLCNVFSIATDVGESKNIIENFGCVVKPEDPSALCDAMLKSFNFFVDNKKDFLEMTKKGRVHVVNNYSINLMLKNYHDVWNN